jgi:hypothetical protein
MLEKMNTKVAIKIIKNGKRKAPETPPRVESAAGLHRWSTAVQSWVSEFQKRRGESQPGFDSLFK